MFVPGVTDVYELLIDVLYVVYDDRLENIRKYVIGERIRFSLYSVCDYQMVYTPTKQICLKCSIV